MIANPEHEVVKDINSLPKPTAPKNFRNDPHNVQFQIKSFGAVFVFAKAKLSQTIVFSQQN